MGVSEKRRSTRVREDEVTVRRCRTCRVEKPLGDEDFYALQRTDIKVVYNWECKLCQIERTNALARAKRRDPATRAEVLRKEAAYKRRWRKANREAARLAVRRYKDRVLADPQRHAVSLEVQRINYRLRQEQLGRPLGSARPTKGHLVRYRSGPIYEANPDKRVAHPDGGDCIEVWRGPHRRPPGGARAVAVPGPDVLNALPAAPLAKAIMDRVPKRDIDFSLEEFCQALGITARALFRWRNGNAARVQFNAADKVLTNLGLLWWDVWPPEEFPDVAERLAA